MEIVDCYLEKPDFTKRPLCLIVIGFAGSGKSSFVKSLKEYLDDNDKTPYTINLDPAVHSLPYEPNIDIRDTINYKEVMQEYKLGPNGAIITSMNLFSTNINDVISLIENKNDLINTVIIDTPGQIEVFKWSASGKVITEALAGSMPTAIVYVIDCVRSVSPVTFMANMMYAAGVAVENELPFVMVMNKTDIVDSSYLNKWMDDVLAFSEDMELTNNGYMTNMVRQTAYALEKFYSNLKRVGVSSMTKQGMKEFVEIMIDLRKEYFEEYLEVILPEKKANKEEHVESIFISSQFNAEEDSESEDIDDGDEFEDY